MAKAPDGSFWVAHRGDRVREAAVDEADGASGSARVPVATAQSAALAPVLGPTLLHIEADTGRVLQARPQPAQILLQSCMPERPTLPDKHVTNLICACTQSSSACVS